MDFPPQVSVLCTTRLQFSSHLKYSVPVGALAITVLVFALPNAFPYHGLPKRATVPFRRIDFGGFFLMIASITLLMVGFEEASNSAAWVSTRFLVPVLVSIPFWVAFIVYERHVTVSGAEGQEPVFPWRFCCDRVMMGVIWYVPAAITLYDIWKTLRQITVTLF